MRARIRLAVIALAGALTVVGLAPAASATYGTQPVGPTWVPDGGVHAVVTDGSTVYVGGAFTGGVAALDALSGSLKWLGNANGDVRALALNGGHLLLGGAFTTVGGATHRKLASVDATTGAVDAAFKPTAGGTVRDIVVANGIAYFGGAFTNQNGITQGGLGAVDATTGTVVPGFNASTNGQVYALGTDGTRLYIGGKFTAVNGLTRNTLASVTLATNALDSWAPAPGCAITNCNVIWDLAVDTAKHRVYTVGRNPGTLYTVDTGPAATVIFRAPGAFNGDSQAVTLAPDGHVYVGGHYVRITIKGVAYTRMLLAEFDVSGSTPVLQAFSTRFVTSYPGVWALASTNSRLYVGGDFTAAGDKVNNQNKFPFFAIFADGSVDTTAPTVTATSPISGATDVATSTDVTATFSEPVNVDGNSFTLTTGSAAVAATVSFANNVATLHPTSALAAGATYTATLTSAITDTAGNHFAGTTWTFTTAPPPDNTAPTVTGTSPTNGAGDVPTSTDVTATFSEAVKGVDGNSFTLTGGGGSVAATVSVVNNVATLHPTSGLAPSTQYTAALSAAITDLAGNALTATSWTFTTAAQSTPTGPTATLTRPLDGENSVAPGTNVIVTFSEKVQGVDTGLTITPSVGTFVLTSNKAGTVWTLNPDANLAKDTVYTVSATTGITSTASGTPVQPATWHFTTGPAPLVSAQTPLPGATGVSTTQPAITVTFNEVVQNVTAVTFTLKDAGGNAVDATPTTSGSPAGKKWTLTPSGPLASGTTYTVTVVGGSGGVTDAVGNPLGADVTWTFTTA